MSDPESEVGGQPSDESTDLLLAMCDGKEGAAEQLVPAVYDELRKIGQRLLNQERIGHTLQPTALVNEAYLKMIDQERVNWQGRAHFCAIAANFMRRILCDYARERSAQKRGGNARRVELIDVELPRSDFAEFDIIDLDEALQRLAELNPRHAQIIEMRYFGGLTIEDTAHALDVSPTTVKNEWRMARAWIRSELFDE